LNLERLKEVAQQTQSRYSAFPITFEKRDFWVKKERKSGSNIFHHLLYFFLKHPITIPTKTKSPKQTFLYEYNKIKQLESLQICVPKIVLLADDFFVMEDSGQSVHHLLNSSHDKQLPQQLLSQSLQVLISIHNADLFHGSAQIKNYTFSNSTVYVLDFEESFCENIRIEDLQLRDLFLFLLSASRVQKEIDYQHLIDIYQTDSKNKYFKQELINISHKFSFVLSLLENRVIWKFLDKDTKGICKLLKNLQNLK
jgi:tRNA A-37 threonylcarbamoyl transferase component Bud32